MSLITRCPLCQTAFRLAPGQLDAADGLVRCGACTHVFNAGRHLVSSEPAIAAPGSGDAGAEQSIGIEESYIREMLLEEPAPFDAPAPAPASTALRDDLAAVAEDLAALAEDLAAPSARVEEAPPPEPAPVEAAPAAPARGPEDSALGPSGSAPAPAFVPPPLEIGSSRDSPPTRRVSVPWAAGCVAAALLLCLQYAWHAREQWLRDPDMRPRLDALCALAGCRLPRPEAPGLIRGAGLVIRPAPGRDGVLLVDALLTNRAAWPQRWPALEIVFADIGGRTLAGRVFGPAQYLGTAPREDMPVGQAVAVHLEIRDPGEDATSYRLFVREAGAGD